MKRITFNKRRRERIQPPPGKSERFWARKAGEPDALWNRRIAGGSLDALEAKLAAIDAEHAAKWPRALHVF